MAIQGMMEVRIMENCEKYLGLPMVGGKSKVNRLNTCKDLREKNYKEIYRMKNEKFISKEGVGKS